jgi:hypothetical protein
MSALITAIGPELSLAGGTIENMRSSFLIVCSMLIDHPDVLTQSEGIYCIQQLHLFAPRFVQLDNLVSMVCSLINSPHLVLRKAGLSTLCQLLQREAKQVHELANNLIIPLALMPKPGKKRLVLLPDTGLEGALFDMLDLEFDDQITRNIKVFKLKCKTIYYLLPLRNRKYFWFNRHPSIISIFGLFFAEMLSLLL